MCGILLLKVMLFTKNELNQTIFIHYTIFHKYAQFLFKFENVKRNVQTEYFVLFQKSFQLSACIAAKQLFRSIMI